MKCWFVFVFVRVFVNVNVFVMVFFFVNTEINFEFLEGFVEDFEVGFVAYLGDEAALFGTEDVAGAADVEVSHGDVEAAADI